MEQLEGLTFIIILMI